MYKARRKTTFSVYGKNNPRWQCWHCHTGYFTGEKSIAFFFGLYATAFSITVIILFRDDSSPLSEEAMFPSLLIHPYGTTATILCLTTDSLYI